MSKFKVKKITPEQVKTKNKFWRWMVRHFGIRFSFAIIGVILLSGSFLGCAVFFKAVIEVDIPKRIGLKDFFDLPQDEYGHTNIALLGVAGKNEEGGYLTDSILLVSINPETPSVSMLSLPRDLYVDSKIGSRKINEIYAIARFRHREDDDKGMNSALQIIKKAIGGFTGVEVHYGAVVDFKMFEEIIDAFGGIEVFVPETIEDPFYPDDNYGFQTFVVRKGLQTMDGETALKYARSRKTSSDYDRAQRQQTLLLAIKNRAAKINLLTNPDKLVEFYTLFKANVNTDLKVTDIGSLAKLSTGINLDNAVKAVLNDDPARVGGYLYTPAKEDYGGQFVLLPKDLKETQTFMNLVLEQPEILLENAQIAILNGTKESGKAGENAGRLRRLGLHVIDVGNHDNVNAPVARTYLEDISEVKEKTLTFLKQLYNVQKVDTMNSTLTVEASAAEDDPESSPATTESVEESLIDIKVILGIN